MKKEDWQLGALLLVAGFGLCAWQVYEVSETDHLTFWVIGIFPIPVIVLGAILLLLGLLVLVGSFLGPAGRTSVSIGSKASTRAPLAFFGLVLVGIVAAGYAFAPQEYLAHILWISAFLAWLWVSGLNESVFGVHCPACGQEAKRAPLGACTRCSALVPRVLLDNLLFFALLLAAAVYWSRLIGQPHLRALLRWGFGLFAARSLLKMFLAFVPTLRKRPAVLDTAVNLVALAVVLAAPAVAPFDSLRRHVYWLAGIPLLMLADSALRIFVGTGVCPSCGATYEAKGRLRCSSCDAFFWPGLVAGSVWCAYLVAATVYWSPTITESWARHVIVLGALFWGFTVISGVAALFRAIGARL